MGRAHDGVRTMMAIISGGGWGCKGARRGSCVHFPPVNHSHKPEQQEDVEEGSDQNSLHR